MSQLADLARPFPQRLIRSNPSGGGSYVPHPAYTQRLLLTYGEYGWEVVEVIRGDVPGKPGDPNGSSARAKAGTPDLHNVIVGVLMRLTIPGNKKPYENVGDCESPHNWPHDGARLKDAVSDAKKRCCADAGLGLHLYMGDPKDYVLYDQLKSREIEAGPSGGGEPSGQTLVAGNPAGESNDLTVPANPPPAPSEFGLCEPCSADDCQHCWQRTDDSPYDCECSHGRPK